MQKQLIIFAIEFYFKTTYKAAIMFWPTFKIFFIPEVKTTACFLELKVNIVAGIQRHALRKSYLYDTLLPMTPCELKSWNCLLGTSENQA